MTTDSATAKRRAPVLTLSAHEWRLWLTTALAGTYALVWLALRPEAAAAPADARPNASLRARPTAPPRGSRESPATRREVLWLAELPPDERPTVVLPAGWTLSTTSPSRGETRAARLTGAPVAALRLDSSPGTRPAPRFVEATRRRVRVRTRSS